jgi:hypothetical protein
MNDRRINDLVRMAMEADELEADAQSPDRHLAGAIDAVPSGRSGSLRGWWAGAALAAAGIAVVVALPFFTGHASKPGATIVEGRLGVPGPKGTIEVVSPAVVVNTALERVDPGTVERCVVVAIFRDDHGRMNCVKSKPHEWSENRCLGEVSSQELRRVVVGQGCSSSADQALMVALAGPQRSLPKTEADAMGLATCILGSPCENDPRCLANAAAECVPAEVSVKIETVASSR